jgi:hypothetical protein
LHLLRRLSVIHLAQLTTLPISQYHFQAFSAINTGQTLDPAGATSVDDNGGIALIAGWFPSSRQRLHTLPAISLIPSTPERVLPPFAAPCGPWTISLAWSLSPMPAFR